MSANTEIAWTDATYNPWWGCTNVSPGCDNCYAEAFAKRTGHQVWGSGTGRRFFGEAHWNEPLKWNRTAEREGRRIKVFCASMADVFEMNHDLDAERVRLWELIDATPQLTWQLLTKRPENVPRMVPWHWMDGGWPHNVWIGTTVEDQTRANLRLPRLLGIPAAVRFLSCEPLLGSLDLSRWLGIEWMDALRVPGESQSWRGEGGWGAEMFATLKGERPGIHWVICGGESGPRFRPLDLDWARDLRDQCQAAEVAYFFKQVGGRTPKAGGNELDGRSWQEFPP